MLTATAKKHNFSPGPAIIPPSVLEQAANALLDYQGTGLSFAEMSHRSPRVMEIVEESSVLVKKLYHMGDDFEVIWVQGGASAQLAIAPMNLVDAHQSIAAVDTGFWATKAIEAAAQLCNVRVLASSKATQYDHIPKNWTIPADAQYLHVASNETIDGTQYHDYPNVNENGENVPIVADMTSDFLTRPLPLEKFGLIFASAQKNFGLAGVTCVVIRKDLLQRNVQRTIPTIFDYKTHITHQSLYHTAPTFPILVANLALHWTLNEGGLVEMERRNREKSTLLYRELERNGLFYGSVQPEDRSLMNVCFRAVNPTIEAEFLAFAEANDVVGIKGFPTVGGFRASMYNAMPLESAQLLVELMRDFEARKG